MVLHARAIVYTAPYPRLIMSGEREKPTTKTLGGIRLARGETIRDADLKSGGLPWHRVLDPFDLKDATAISLRCRLSAVAHCQACQAYLGVQ